MQDNSEDLSPNSGSSSRTGRRDLLILLLIVVTGAAIRLYRMDAQSVWFDEAFSIAHSARPYPELFRALFFDAVHPPLHYLVLHGWFQVVGFGATQARLSTAILGTLTIPLLFLIARRFTDSTTSLAAAFLLATSQMGVYFSQEARPYAQAQFLSMVAALTFLWFLENPGWRRSMAFAAAGTALLYTHYYGAGTLLALGFYWLIFRRDYSPAAFRWLAAAAVLMVFALVPWFLAVKSGGRMNPQRLVKKERPAGERPSLASPLGALNRFNNAKFESIEAPTSIPQALLGLAVFTFPAVGGLWITGRRRAHGPVLGLLLAATPVAMAIFFGALGFMFNYRHFSFAVPGYYLAVAIGWRSCLPNALARSTWLAIAAVVSVFALRANHTVTKPDYREGFRPLEARFQNGDCVTGLPRLWHNQVHLAWEVYYRDRGMPRLVPFSSLDSAPVTCKRLWVVWDRTSWMNLNQAAAEKSAEAIAALQQHYRAAERYDHPAVNLQLLVRKPGGAAGQ